MTAPIDTTSPQFTLAFAFARSVRSPLIRERMKALGFKGEQGDTIVAWPPGDTVAEVLDRVQPEAERVLLVRPDTSQECGWWMDWAKEAEQ